MTGTVQVSFVVYGTDTLFPSTSTNQTRFVGGDIIAAVVSGVKNLTDLKDPVVLELIVSVYFYFNIDHAYIV